MTSSLASRQIRRWLLATLAVSCLALQFTGELFYSFGALVLWLAAVALVDVKAIRRLWLPKFWIVSIVISLTSGLLLGSADFTIANISISVEGCKAGALMVIRGALLMSLSSWSTRLIGSAKLQDTFRRLGFVGFGKAMSAAFSLLPDLAAQLRHRTNDWRQGRKKNGRHFALLYEIAIDVIVDTARLAEKTTAEGMQTNGSLKSQNNSVLLAAIVGPPGSGKTSLAFQVVKSLREQGVSIGGILQPGIHKGGARLGYKLHNLTDGEERDFASKHRSHHDHCEDLGFDFNSEGWIWARDLILHLPDHTQVLAVDEMGKMESIGQGHMPAVEKSLANGKPRVALLSIRLDCLDRIEMRLGKPVFRLDTTKPETVKSFVRQIVEALALTRGDLGSN